MIYTGYWAKIKEYESYGLTPVGISGKIPDGFNGARYQQLAPKYTWWKQWHDEHMSNDWFVERYYKYQETNPRLVNKVRGELAYTGEYKGVSVTIFASGMGIPSMGIYSYELFHDYDVEKIIRIGTAGSYLEDLKVYDILLLA